MFKLRADSPTWAVAESEGDEITAFVSHDETKAQVVFKKDNDPSVGLASEPITVSLIGLYDGSQNLCCLRPHTTDVVRLAWEMLCTNRGNLQDAVLRQLQEASVGLDNPVEISRNPFREGMIARVFVDGDLADIHLLSTWIADGSLFIQDRDEVVFQEPFVIRENNRENGYRVVALALSEVDE